MKSALTIHLLPNAHLDPVWLWDWREGLNEGIQTCRTVLDLMDEDPSLTFVRGEAMVYRHIEQYDPETFARIRAQVEAGRWDVVGGTLIQADNNLTSTEAAVRQFVVGQSYFRKTFGKPVKVAWSADAFGHSAGLPEILQAGGIESFVFTRPVFQELPIESPAFWWEGSSGARVLAYRPSSNYLSDRTGVAQTLDRLMEESRESDLRTIGFCYGIGNHGGGPTRALQAQIAAWSALHPEVTIVPSGLHRFLEDLRGEVTRSGLNLPVHRGELGHCLRGCYSSGARLKFLYRKTESRLLRAERSSSAIAAALAREPVGLDSAWEELLFNAFHDILPGTSIERATEEQMSWLGSVDLKSQRSEMNGLTALALRVDTTVAPVEGDRPGAVPVLVWNPHPYPYNGQVEVEACLDYRPIFSYEGRIDELPVQVLDANKKPLPFQEIAKENEFLPVWPWRKRLVVPVSLPPMGWTVLEYGWVEGTVPVGVESCLRADASRGIENETYRIQALPGTQGINLWHRGELLFAGDGLGVSLFEDPWGSWGGMSEEPDSINISTEIEKWEITQTKILETGPERVSLWIRFAGPRSSIEFTCSLSRGREAVDWKCRVFWNERQARLKLVFPFGDKDNHAEFDAPGGTVERTPGGEVPGGHWVRIMNGKSRFGFASDALTNFDLQVGTFRATVLRSAGYATSGQSPGWDECWRPVSDSGDYRFQFLLQPGDGSLEALAGELEQPPIASIVPSGRGELPREASLLKIEPEGVRILALTPAGKPNDFILRVQSYVATDVVLTWLGSRLELGSLGKAEIQTWRLSKEGGKWSAQAISAC